MKKDERLSQHDNNNSSKNKRKQSRHLPTTKMRMVVSH